MSQNQPPPDEGVPPHVQEAVMNRAARRRAEKGIAPPPGQPETPGQRMVELQNKELITMNGVLNHLRGEMSEAYVKLGECFNMLTWCRQEFQRIAMQTQQQQEMMLAAEMETLKRQDQKEGAESAEPIPIGGAPGAPAEPASPEPETADAPEGVDAPSTGGAPTPN
jgi:hypothetical protein